MQIVGSPDQTIERVACCVGSAGSLPFRLDLQPTDAIVTGEMRHHDVLAAIERGASVVLCEHTNTERGFLRIFARRLRQCLGADVAVALARADAEPLGVR